jgi:hypothetical protein
MMKKMAQEKEKKAQQLLGAIQSSKNKEQVG